MTKALTISQKKEWAKMLFLSNDLTQRAIADKVGASEKAISQWVNKEKWNDLRRSLLTMKSEILRRLYNHLDKLSEKMDKEEVDSKSADAFMKLTASIKNLESETSIAQIMEVGTQFHKYLLGIDPQFALSVLNHIDSFIKEKLKRF